MSESSSVCLVTGLGCELGSFCSLLGPSLIADLSETTRIIQRAEASS